MSSNNIMLHRLHDDACSTCVFRHDDDDGDDDDDEGYMTNRFKTPFVKPI
jgi:hypothetical protein